MKTNDLESLREIFTDRRMWIGKGVILETELASDLSLFRAKVKLYPSEREVIAVCASSGGTGPDAGVFMLPVKDDLVLVANANGEDDWCYVISRLTSKQDKIPAHAEPGAYVARALEGKKSYVESDTEANIRSPKVQLMGLETEEAEEPLVLGLVLTSMLTDLIAKFDASLQAIITGPVGIGNLGAPVPTDPGLIAQLTAIKAELLILKTEYLDTESTNIVSQLSFTERGGE